jgi:hypothetical protein
MTGTDGLPLPGNSFVIPVIQSTANLRRPIAKMQ